MGAVVISFPTDARRQAVRDEATRATRAAAARIFEHTPDYMIDSHGRIVPVDDDHPGHEHSAPAAAARR